MNINVVCVSIMKLLLMLSMLGPEHELVHVVCGLGTRVGRNKTENWCVYIYICTLDSGIIELKQQHI